MIKFFRKIRKKLLSESKFNRYLIYAIGEITLVVIGILIALQVNNWNQSQIELRKIKGYAKALISDLESDIDMLKVSHFQALKKYHDIDSMRSYVLNTSIENYLIPTCSYYHTTLCIAHINGIDPHSMN